MSSDGLVYTDVSLCERQIPEEVDLLSGLLEEWPRSGIRRFEAPIDSFQDSAVQLLISNGAPIQVRCPRLLPRDEATYPPRVLGVTLWVESAAHLARRENGVTRPGSAVGLRRSAETARARGLDVTIAFPLELDRTRTLLNFGYLAQSAGADQIRLVDSRGTLHPLDLFRTLRYLRERLTIPIELDLSNRWDLAVGAALCAIRAGVRRLVVSTGALSSDHSHIPRQSLEECVRAAVW